jgi:hypothetical protein
MRLACLFLLAVPLLAQNPATAVFPSAVAGDSDLFCWKNSGTTQLNGSINNSTLTVVVDDGSKLCAPGVVTIGSERMKVCSISTNTLTICSGGRGFDGSSAASHSDDAAVAQFVPARWLNQMAAEIKAIQTALGVGLTNVLTDPGAAGIIARKADDTVVNRTLTGTAGQISIANPAGDGGNPTFSLGFSTEGGLEAIVGVDLIKNTDINSKAKLDGYAGVTLVDTGSAQMLLQKTLFTPKVAATVVASIGSVVPSPEAAQVLVILDGLDGSDCTTGGGSQYVLCMYTGSAWTPVSGGSGSPNAATLASENDADNALIKADGVSGRAVQKSACSESSGTLTCPSLATSGDDSFIDLPEESSPGTPSANVARVYAKDVGGVTKLCMADSAASETCFGTSRAYLFSFAFGGSNGVNGWGSTNIYDGWACSVCTISGGTKAAHGTLNFDDTASEVAYLRVGRVPDDVDLGNITIELEGVSSNTATTGDVEFDVDFACLSAGADLDVEPSTLSWSAADAVSANKGTSTALATLLLTNGGGHDISGSCSAGQLMFARFTYDNAASALAFRLFSGRAYSP